MFTQRGHNLIELMLTLVISCILLKLIFNIFIGANLASQSIDEIHAIQTNAATLIATLTTDIKQSTNVTIKNNILTVTHPEFPAERIIEATRKSITATAKKHFLPNDYLVLSNFIHTEILKVHKVYKLRDSQMVTFDKPTNYKYNAGAEVSRLIINKYFQKQSSVYIEDIKGQKSELVTDINRFNISFADKGVIVDVAVMTAHLQKTWHLFCALPIKTF